MTTASSSQKIRILTGGISDGLPLAEIISKFPEAEIDCDRATPDQLAIIDKILQLRPDEAKRLVKIVSQPENSAALKVVLSIFNHPRELQLIADYLEARENKPLAPAQISTS